MPAEIAASGPARTVLIFAQATKEGDVLWTAKHVPGDDGWAFWDAPAWRAALRRGAACRFAEVAVSFDEAKVAVAARLAARTCASRDARARDASDREVPTAPFRRHLRRGDVDARTDPNRRWVSDDCLLETIRWIRGEVADAVRGAEVDARVFSSVEAKRGHNNTRAADFDVYERAGVRAHLDAPGDRRGGNQTAWCSQGAVWSARAPEHFGEIFLGERRGIRL